MFTIDIVANDFKYYKQLSLKGSYRIGKKQKMWRSQI